MLGNAILALHIAAGGLALVVSAIALWSFKGGRVHRRAGRIFVAAMGVVCATAIVLAVLRPNAFLLAIGFFSFYLSFAGFATVRPAWGRAAIAIAAGMILVGLAMLGAAATGATARPVVLGIFGAIGLVLAIQDLAALRGAEVPPARIARHLSRMLGATIATWTAFTVVNFQMLPPLVAWLGPTAAFLPVIVYWNRRVRLSRRPQISAA
jgi:uncharacterized membrane protein